MRKGFTLIELLIGVAIIAIFSVVVIMTIEDGIKRLNVDECKSNAAGMSYHGW